MPLLSVRNVTRRFGGIVAIDDVSLDVEQGQIVGLIGPNGAGKTTLFNIVTRLYKPDSGALEFNGKSLLHTPPHRVVRRGIARTFQNVELFRTMTVLDNVLVGSYSVTRPFRSGTSEAKAKEVLEYVGIADVVRVGARCARPVPGAASRARDRRRARRRDRTRRTRHCGADRCDRVRAERRDPASPRPRQGRRRAVPLCLRAFRLPCAGHRSTGALTRQPASAQGA